MLRGNMNKNILLISLPLTIVFCLLADALLMFCSVYLPMWKFLLLCAGILIICAVLTACVPRVAKGLLIGLMVFLAAAAISIPMFWRYAQSEQFLQSTIYQESDFEKEELFAGKTVLLIVPHEDDDINVLGGVIDQYLHYGSLLTVAFMTNGDYNGIGETRLREAISLYDYLGLPEEQVVFLGYGDNLHTQSNHIYNAPENEVIISQTGRTETYGLETHPPLHDGHEYTYSNLYTDMKDLILTRRPDVIYCVDFDPHVDHKACSLLFEKVMGDILRSELDYSPEVFKGFGYSTAWGAEHDFFSLNLNATVDIYHNSLIIQTPAVFRWEERLRLPVKAGLLARSLQASLLEKELGFYQSQNAAGRGVAIINGDKVFWRRATDSLLRDAILTTSSGDPNLLNNFMLLDSRHILDQYHDPYDGTWAPEDEDPDKMATIEFKSPERISEIVLYDNPDENSNILNAEICFNDGTVYKTGPLDPSGAASHFAIEKNNVTSFILKLTETEGERAGLTEIEAFCEPQKRSPTFLKLMDSNEDFAYDYIVGINGKSAFLLYSDGEIPELIPEYYEICCDSDVGCSAVIKDGMLRVFCPRGKRAEISITCRENGLADRIVVQNPTIIRRAAMLMSQRMELIELEDYELLHIFRFVGKPTA